MHNRCLIIFFKRFTHNVKTRIGRTAGPEAALKLYRSMLLDLQKNLSPLPVPVLPFADGPGELFWPDAEFQRGTDIGERMENAFLKVFPDRESVILIGSDIPQITAALVDEGFRGLKENDMVIGPADDGGYYLLGFSREGFFKQREQRESGLFSRMPWSTDAVYPETIKRARKRGLSFSELPVMTDLDTLEDVRTAAASPWGKILPAVKKTLAGVTEGPDRRNR
jgi:hypothetical protein